MATGIGFAELIAIVTRGRRPRRKIEIVTDPVASARAAGLRYVSAEGPGIRRVRSGQGFRYLDVGGRLIRDASTLGRIRQLAIPPAWSDVWISPLAHGHLQAMGRDARGRKQYRYHARWRVIRDETKYNRMVLFAEVLPRLRARIAKDLARPGLPGPKVLAAIVRLLETTLIRIGNDEYARDNASYGLTTLRDGHVEVRSATLRFHFRGKGGKEHDVVVRDRQVAGIVKRCRNLPGRELFQYVDDDGARQTIDSGHVNAYLREVTGHEFTAKDFRTWAGTVLAAVALRELAVVDSRTQAKRAMKRAVEAVARMLANTPTICRKSYIHPGVMDAYLDGSITAVVEARSGRRTATGLAGLTPDEALVVALLERRARAIEQHAARAA